MLCARFMEHTFAQYNAAVLSSVVDFLLHHTAVCRSLGEARQTFMAPPQASVPSQTAPMPDMPPPRHTWNDSDAVPAARYRVAAE